MEAGCSVIQARGIRGVATSLEEMDEFQGRSVQETDSPGRGDLSA